MSTETSSRPKPLARARKRSKWRDYPSIVWLAAAVIISLIHRWVPDSLWLMVHMVLLGALTHSIFVWSRFFTVALTKVNIIDDMLQAENRRIGLLQIGTAAVLIGFPTRWWWLLVIGAVLVVTAVVLHAFAIRGLVKASLSPRFAIATRYYRWAAVLLTFGVLFGALLGLRPDDDWHGRLLTAHLAANILGWVGLTVTGTLVTFWLTLLRTRMDPRAAGLAGQALPVLLTAVAVIMGGSLLGWTPAAGIGLLIYLAGLIWWGRALIAPLRAKRPREFAAASVLCSMPWFVVGLVWVGWILVFGDGWAEISDRIFWIAGIFTVGFALQLLTGALSYLIPTVLRGGPAAVRANTARFNKGAAVRLVVINLGLVVFLFPLPSWIKVTVSTAVLIALAAFIPILMSTIILTVRERKAMAKAKAEGADEASAASGKGRGEDGKQRRRRRTEAPENPFTLRRFLTGVAVLGIAALIGAAVDPSAVGIGSKQTADAPVAPTGETVTVDVSAEGMAFHPSSIDINAGDRVVINLTNNDSEQTHDLRVAGVSSDRLLPGEKAQLDLGVIGADTEGWCTIAGHRQMGMTFDINVEGGAENQASAGDSTGDSGQAGSASGEQVHSDPDAKLDSAIDPKLKPLPKGRKTHKVRIEISEEPIEIAPGVWQKRWTYNGGPLGPTLHGHVGDKFEVTLVNNGTMGHSIDFHASAVAPDRLMKTIQPGEELQYDFTAERAGAWMYHCGTAPVSSHIASGMAGAVVIEPDDLEEVDEQFVFVQSEVYMDGTGRNPKEAREVNGAKVAAKSPDFVTFNGVADQYAQHPITVPTGKKVRMWVVNIGPNLPTSFHVIGGQFDTVYSEGGYRLKDGRDPFGTEDGGSQALGLQAAQGGFVELTFPEAGTYKVVDHIMSDHERGAYGLVKAEK